MFLQDFYSEILSDGAYREERFIDIGRKEGIPEYKVEKTLREGKVQHTCLVCSKAKLDCAS